MDGGHHWSLLGMGVRVYQTCKELVREPRDRLSPSALEGLVSSRAEGSSVQGQHTARKRGCLEYVSWLPGCGDESERTGGDTWAYSGN